MPQWRCAGCSQAPNLSLLLLVNRANDRDRPTQFPRHRTAVLEPTDEVPNTEITNVFIFLFASDLTGRAVSCASLIATRVKRSIEKQQKTIGTLNALKMPNELVAEHGKAIPGPECYSRRLEGSRIAHRTRIRGAAVESLRPAHGCLVQQPL
jgi:hypothetical protein